MPLSSSWNRFARFARRAIFACACTACSAQPALLRLRSTPERPVAGASAWAAVEADVEAALEADRGRRLAEGDAPSLAIAATGAALVAFALEARGTEVRRWSVQAAVVGSPVLAGGLVVYGTRDEIVALSAEDGARRWALEARGRTLLAASASAGHTALLLRDRVGQPSLAICDDAGRERLNVVADAALGTPALLGDLLLVPFGDGNVSALGVAAAVERGRARLGSEPLHALSSPEGLFFGGPPWVALGGSASSYGLPRRPLPGLVLSGPEPEPAPPHADVTRLYVHPTRTSSPAGDDVYMGTHGRVAFGLERERGSLIWVVALPGRALAGTLVASGLLVCDDSGALRLLAARSGSVLSKWQLVRRPRPAVEERALSSCAFRPGRTPDAEEARAEPPLLEQIARVLVLSDPGLTDAQRFLSRELAARPEPEATRVLIELVTRHSLDRVLQSEAEDLLAIRRNGQDYMLAALTGERGDDDTALPPIAPLGEALAALGERRAAPLLARQLNRPAHTAAALARAAAALEQLASESEYDELSVFFSLHRTTADSPELVSAVVSVGKTLLRVAGPRARGLIGFATRDALTVPDVRAALERELHERAEPPESPPGPSPSG